MLKYPYLNVMLGHVYTFSSIAVLAPFFISGNIYNAIGKSLMSDRNL